MGKIRVFISSTCYDLSQIRKDLKEGIEAMGHVPILSEYKDFPVSPGQSTAENCINAIRNETDVFVLIIGNRYGYKFESGKSITNTEFLTALNEGIPIYTFTLKSLIHLLPTWKKNPQADFSGDVDDTKVFEFVDEIRSKNGIWNFEFETAQDILEILKSQWSFLFQQTLVIWRKLKESDNSLLPQLSDRAVRLLLNKPENYEMLVFLQMMQDEIGKYKFLKKDCEHSIIVKPGQSVSDPVQFKDWQQEKLSQVDKLINNLNRLFDAIQHYIGAPGVPSDIYGLYYVAQRYGEFYESLLKWVIDVRSVNVPEVYSEVVSALSDIPIKAIGQLEDYPKESMEKILDASSKIKNGVLKKGAHLSLMLHLTIDENVQARFSTALDRLRNHFLD